MKMWCSAAIHFGGSLSSPIFTSSTVRVNKAFDVNCRPQACIVRTTRADVIYVIVFALETQTLVTADVLFFLSFFFPVLLSYLLTYLFYLFISYSCCSTQSPGSTLQPNCVLPIHLWKQERSTRNFNTLCISVSIRGSAFCYKSDLRFKQEA